MRRAVGIFIVALVFLLTSCVHEFPVPHPELVSYRLNLEFDTEMSLHENVSYDTDEGTKLSSATHDLRYVVNVYPVDKEGVESRVPDTSFVYTVSSLSALNRSIDFNIKEGSYVFRVWADYVDAGSLADKYYLTDDFSEIILADKSRHSGSNDYRDAFRGSVQAEVINPAYYRGEAVNTIATESTVVMQRPMGKFKFVSTDVETFIMKVMQMRAESSDTPGEMLDEINLNDFNVVFRYNAFMPCSYNMFTDKPADSWTGVSFNGHMVQEAEKELSLGYDYVFVNGKETTMNITVEVYDKDGRMMSRSHPVDVPVKRSRLTVVKGEFLTSKASGGVTISPGYDGEDYNIELK